MLHEITIENYRSIQKLTLEFSQLNIITGHNGSGKSNSYKALQLIQDAALGRFAERIVAEGGLTSLMWAGDLARTLYNTNRRAQLNLLLKDNEYVYELKAGIPLPVPGSMFVFDPEIKEEKLWIGPVARPSALLVERNANAVISHYPEKKVTPFVLSLSESLLSQLKSPDLEPQLFTFLHKVLAWRFYHYFDVGANSIIRQARPCSRSVILDNNGANLVAAIRTIYEIGNEELFAEYIAAAFNGASIDIVNHDYSTAFKLEFKQKNLKRPLMLSELSEGTLKFICLLTALLSPRPAAVFILNEPEANLHRDLIVVLARLIAEVGQSSQIILITHSSLLQNEITKISPHVNNIELEFGKYGTSAIES